MSGSQLFEYLLQRAYVSEQISEHSVHVLWVLEVAARMGKSAHRFGGFTGISDWIVERRHNGLLHEECWITDLIGVLGRAT